MTVGKQSRKKRRADYLDSLNWMPDQLYYKLGNVNYIFSYTMFDKSLVTREQVSTVFVCLSTPTVYIFKIYLSRICNTLKEFSYFQIKKIFFF